ncbi:hypothetical protein QE152_g29961 [Popillia japonica]|uniref:Uncharacterized protein n=1 Tax=Popillia japonica TaxID=7064 RepID=A0AAW1JFA9_POPJA
MIVLFSALISLASKADTILHYFNSFNPHLQFTIEIEQQRGIPFLDVICRPKLHELEEILLQDNDEVEVVLVSPDGGDITDEDSGDENEINL